MLRATNSRAAKPLPCRGKIFLGIDTRRHRVDLCHGNVHAGLQCAKLLQLLGHLQRRRGQLDKPRQRLAPPSIDADMMIFRCRTGWYRGAAEIERPADTGYADTGYADTGYVDSGRCCAVLPADHRLYDLRARRLFLVGKGDKRRQLGPAVLGCGKKRRRDHRVKLGKVALQVEDHIELPVRVDPFNRLKGAV